MAKFLGLILVVMLSVSTAFAASEPPAYPRGRNFDRLAYIGALNDRFFDLYNKVFTAVEQGADKQEGTRAQFLSHLAELNRLYSLRAWKLQPQVDQAWYEAMHSLHRLLSQKTGRSKILPIARVVQVQLDPKLWSSACAELL